MKLRKGFVSNSSSSSFVIDPKYVTKGLDDIQKKLEMLLDFYNKFHGKSLKFEDVFEEPFVLYEENYDLSNQFAGNSSEWDIRAPKGSVIINSTGDNSIPWEIMQWIEWGMLATRYHLG